MAVVSLTDYEPRPRYDGNAWTVVNLEISPDLETWTINESITFEDPDADPAEPKMRQFTTVVTDPDARYIRVVFVDNYGNGDLTDPVVIDQGAALATVSDVLVRLGWNDLTEAQEAQVNLLLNMATINILNAVDKDVAWTPPPNVKQLMSMMCVELVCRAMSNPQAIGQISETIGARSYTTTFPREIPGSGIMLTDLEERMLRRAVWGQNSGIERGSSDVLNAGLVDILTREPISWNGDE